MCDNHRSIILMFYVFSLAIMQKLTEIYGNKTDFLATFTFYLTICEEIEMNSLFTRGLCNAVIVKHGYRSTDLH